MRRESAIYSGPKPSPNPFNFLKLSSPPVHKDTSEPPLCSGIGRFRRQAGLTLGWERRARIEENRLGCQQKRDEGKQAKGREITVCILCHSLPSSESPSPADAPPPSSEGIPDRPRVARGFSQPAAGGLRSYIRRYHTTREGVCFYSGSSLSSAPPIKLSHSKEEHGHPAAHISTWSSSLSSVNVDERIPTTTTSSSC